MNKYTKNYRVKQIFRKKLKLINDGLTYSKFYDRQEIYLAQKRFLWVFWVTIGEFSEEVAAAEHIREEVYYQENTE